MEQSIFLQLSIVMVIAAVVSLVARALRQPMIIAYILTGIIVGPSLLNVITAHDAFHSFSEIGIALLLFIIGLELSVHAIKSAGRPVATAFLVNMIGVVLIGYAGNRLLGFTAMESFLIALALLFSSTIIIIKALSDKKEQNRLYGQIAIGVILVEDLVAAIALLAISSLTDANGNQSNIYSLLGKGMLLAGTLTFVGAYIMPRMSKIFAKSQELLYVFAIAWAFGVASLFHAAGFSLEIGALAAGITLAHVPYVQAIRSRLMPLRDFFLVLFFINLGEGLYLKNIADSLVPAVILSAFVIVSKPLLIMCSLGALGYTKQTSFKAGLHLSQISEFSVILIVLAANFKLVDAGVVNVITLTALITIAVSTYLMKYDDRLYKKFASALSIFERKETKKELKGLNNYQCVLLGYHEGGYAYVQAFRKMKKRYMVIDYNPEVIETLAHQHIKHIYGDATDVELLEEIGIHRSELIISTISDTATNILIAKNIVRANKEAVFVCNATKLDDAEALYEAGAAYVLLPNYIGNMHITDFLERHGASKAAFLKYRSQHLLNIGSVALK